jgi:membrane protein
MIASFAAQSKSRLIRSARWCWLVVKGAAVEWRTDKVPRLAAAIAFYSLFSLAPIVVIAVAMAGAVFGEAAAQRELLNQARYLIGPDGAEAIRILIKHAPPREVSTLATLAGLLTMFFAATGAFAELKDALDTIWEVQPKPGLGIVRLVRHQFLSFAMVLVIGFLMLVSLVASAWLAVLSDRASRYLSDTIFVTRLLHFAAALFTMSILFALIYKVLPDAKVAWRDVWLGATVTAILFNSGKLLFGLYLGHSTIGSSYGAAGSLVIVILWTYYSALILLFGAEITQVQARLRHVPLEPSEIAEVVTEHARVQQGIPHAAAPSNVESPT